MRKIATLYVVACLGMHFLGSSSPAQAEGVYVSCPGIEILDFYYPTEVDYYNTTTGVGAGLIDVRVVARDRDTWLNYRPYWQEYDVIQEMTLIIDDGEGEDERQVSMAVEYIGNGKYEGRILLGYSLVPLDDGFHTIKVEVDDNTLADDNPVQTNTANVKTNHITSPGGGQGMKVGLVKGHQQLINGTAPLARTNPVGIYNSSGSKQYYYGTAIKYGVSGWTTPPGADGALTQTIWTVNPQQGAQIVPNHHSDGVPIPNEPYVIYTQSGAYQVTCRKVFWEEPGVAADPPYEEATSPVLTVYETEIESVKHKGVEVSTGDGFLDPTPDTYTGPWEDKLIVTVKTNPVVASTGDALALYLAFFDTVDPIDHPVLDPADDGTSDNDGDGVAAEGDREATTLFGKNDDFWVGEGKDNRTPAPPNKPLLYKSWYRGEHMKSDGTAEFIVDIPRTPGDNFVLVSSGYSPDIDSPADINPAGNQSWTSQFYDDNTREFMTRYRYIVLDPGHGIAIHADSDSCNTGMSGLGMTESRVTLTPEYEANWFLAGLVESALNDVNPFLDIQITKSDKEANPPLLARAQQGGNPQGLPNPRPFKDDAEFFVSIHFDGTPDGVRTGFTIILPEGPFEETLTCRAKPPDEKIFMTNNHNLSAEVVLGLAMATRVNQALPAQGKQVPFVRQTGSDANKGVLFESGSSAILSPDRWEDKLYFTWPTLPPDDYSYRVKAVLVECERLGNMEADKALHDDNTRYPIDGFNPIVPEYNKLADAIVVSILENVGKF